MNKAFEEKVRLQIERLDKHPHRTIERESAEKRIAWFRETYPEAQDRPRPSPRRAYELFLLEYLGLPEEQVPVLSESETEIVWLSLNECPTLEACQKLGLDTRNVCRAACEKPAQALISQLDPQLRFYRRYDEIRPYAAHCKEMIVRLDFEQMMEQAIREAWISRHEGNKGYGAVLVLPDRIVKAHDTAVTLGDPSLHAEVNAIRQSVQLTGNPDLSGAVLFSTCEPCPMCSSLAVWANLTTIVYGASIEATARLDRSRIRLSAQEVVERSPALIEVVGGVLASECMALYG